MAICYYCFRENVNEWSYSHVDVDIYILSFEVNGMEYESGDVEVELFDTEITTNEKACG